MPEDEAPQAQAPPQLIQPRPGRLPQYVRCAVRHDLGGEERPKADISEIVGVFSSGGSDIAKHKDRTSALLRRKDTGVYDALTR